MRDAGTGSRVVSARRSTRLLIACSRSMAIAFRASMAVVLDCRALAKCSGRGSQAPYAAGGGLRGFGLLLVGADQLGQRAECLVHERQTRGVSAGRAKLQELAGRDGAGRLGGGVRWDGLDDVVAEGARGV